MKPTAGSESENDTSAALSLLRDALGEDEQRIRVEGSQAMQHGDYDTATAVIDAVGKEMKVLLKPKDYEIHKSSGKQLRWRNTCQWARNLMVNADGRMRSDSPRGIWEISDKGKAWLKNHK